MEYFTVTRVSRISLHIYAWFCLFVTRDGMIYWEMEGKRDLIGSTDAGVRSEREKKTARQITCLDLFISLSHL